MRKNKVENIERNALIHPQFLFVPLLILVLWRGWSQGFVKPTLPLRSEKVTVSKEVGGKGGTEQKNRWFVPVVNVLLNPVDAAWKPRQKQPHGHTFCKPACIVVKVLGSMMFPHCPGQRDIIWLFKMAKMVYRYQIYDPRSDPRETPSKGILCL